jgi:hypothetical protein
VSPEGATRERLKEVSQCGLAILEFNLLHHPVYRYMIANSYSSVPQMLFGQQLLAARSIYSLSEMTIKDKRVE